MPQKLYFITVTTAAVDHGGTDSDVFVAIRASNGRWSNFCYLEDPSYPDLEQGQTDTFIFWDEDFDLDSDFEGFGIALRPAGRESSWYLESILVGEWVNNGIGRAAGQIYDPPKYIGHRLLPNDAQIVMPSMFRHSGGSPLAEGGDTTFVGDLQKITSTDLKRFGAREQLRD